MASKILVRPQRILKIAVRIENALANDYNHLRKMIRERGRALLIARELVD